MDQAQRDKIRHATDENLFVVAGAGSGKTTALIERIASLVLHDGVNLATIAAVTFTEKAGAELRDRLRARFEDEVRQGRSVERAEQALTELDLAAIGTLHSFAARILTLHAIEAGLPPELTPVDEIGSGIVQDEQWRRTLVRLLDDEEIRPALHRLLAAQKLESLELLFDSLNKDWDLIESHILSHNLPELRVPELTPLEEAAKRLAVIRQQAITDDDRLVEHIDRGLAWWHSLPVVDGIDRYRTLQGSKDLYDNVNKSGQLIRVGRAPTWKNLAGGSTAAKQAYADFRATAVELATQAQDVTLRHIVHWLAQQVLVAAKERQDSGELTFQDLLVVARQVLRQSPDVAEALHQRYTHLLLDEFQDTDPIQIELAVRIAGGRAGAAHPDWRDICVPGGALFVVGDPKQSIYRFRRANIALYLEVQDWFTDKFGPDSVVTLQTNFRSVPGVLDWVNHTFDKVIQHIDGQQPPYLALHSRPDAVPDTVPAVTHLGAEGHEGPLTADELRTLEALSVAAAITEALREGWTVTSPDRAGGPAGPRALRHSDIAILVPSRTSLALLRDALDAAGIAYRAEAATLLYLNEDIADLIRTLHAVADLSDEFSLVMALRSALFGVGDDDLWRWKQAGGHFSLARFRPAHATDEQRELPVFAALEYLSHLAHQAPRRTPADLLEQLVRERRVLEMAAVASSTSEAADRWRRVRFVIDQARAWSEVSHGGLRAYLEWANRQTSETARVYESVLPETDVDAVHIMTVHAAKGLEFPMVVLSGMTAQPGNRASGIRLLWGDGDYEVRLKGGVETTNFTIAAPIDEQMDAEERKRLLYVATTRARDHLVVSLHRVSDKAVGSAAELLAPAVPQQTSLARSFVSSSAEMLTPVETTSTTPADETRDELRVRLAHARRRSLREPSRTPSGPDASDPEVVLAVAGEEDELRLDLPLAKGQRDLDAPSYVKGRDASAIGIAVHAVLQTIDLTTGEGLAALVEIQCLAEGIPQHADQVTTLVQRALASPEVRTAALHQHWRESLLVMTDADAEITEGYADLIYRDSDGVLHIIDYKTDTIRTPTELRERQAHYASQLRDYERILHEATGAPTTSTALFLDSSV